MSKVKNQATGRYQASPEANIFCDCVMCGAQFCQRMPSGSVRRTQTCSRHCYQAQRASLAIKRLTRACEHCAKPFQAVLIGQRFCGMRCFGDHKIIPGNYRCRRCGEWKDWGAKMCKACWKVEQSSRRDGHHACCKQCGAGIYRSNARWAGSPRTHGAFCNRTCHSLYIRGANNSQYVDGRQPAVYPAKYRGSRSQVLNREKHRCFLCSKDEPLDVHHIDRNEKNNELWNLVALCRRCHNYQRGVGKTKDRPAEVRRLSNVMYGLLSQAYGHQKRSITSRSKATTTTLSAGF